MSFVTTGPGTLLSARPFRSVSLETDGAGRSVVVKRFHHPNPLLARFDRRRARAEYRALVALERAALPVPRPLELCPCPGGWEVRLEAVSAARGLDQLLHSRSAPAGGWERLCAELGALLARLQATGFEHNDLHPGNVLIDALGKPWLIDFHRARWREPARSAVSLRALVEAAAAAREVLSPRTRARFLRSWFTALPAELRPRRERTELGDEIEREARFVRRQTVLAGIGRWLRESSRVRRVVRAGEPLLVRRDLSDRDLEGLSGTPARFLVLALPPRELRSRWLAAARLQEHGIAAAAPAALRAGRKAWAAFELSPGARPLPEPEQAVDRARAAALGALLGALHERGLDLAAEDAELLRLQQGVLCSPPRRLVHLDPLSPAPERWSSLRASLGGSEPWSAFTSCYLDAFQRASERAAIAAQLAGPRA